MVLKVLKSKQISLQFASLLYFVIVVIFPVFNLEMLQSYFKLLYSVSVLSEKHSLSFRLGSYLVCFVGYFLSSVWIVSL